MARPSFSRSGAGASLLLLHGLGSSRAAWDPVVPPLAEHFDVVAVDLPGFGDSDPLPAGVEATPAALAAAVAALLDDLGIERPHVAGNSLGGWVSLELAAIRPVASLTLLSPAGLWPGGIPLYPRVSLAVSRWLARHAAGVLGRLLNSRLGRIVVLGQTHGRPARMSPGQARTAVRALGTAPGFDAAFAATLSRHYASGPALDAPVTVAFGSRDRLLLRRQSRHVDQLPPGTRVAVLPGGGHVPMADTPDAVVALITASAARGRPRAQSA